MILGVIPARFASTRFPGKPLAMIDGMSMIQRVYNQCKKTSVLDKVVVATEDQRILEHVISFGGEAVLTSEHHQSGTDRIGEVIQKITPEPDLVINIQGDEPFINPTQIELLVSLFEKSDTQIATLSKKITDEDPTNPNIVKVVTTNDLKALYFSRSIIPYPRNKKDNTIYYKHLGIYGYRTEVLKNLVQLSPGMLETTESLEQLRWLEAGFTIRVAETEFETISIDTPEDLSLVEKMMKS